MRTMVAVFREPSQKGTLMRGMRLLRTCPFALSLLHLGLFVSLFVPPPGPYSEARWQVLFKQNTV